MIISAEDQATEPARLELDALLGGLVDALGVKGMIVLLTLGTLFLLKSKSVRKAASQALRRAGRWLVRYVRIRLWALRMGMPLRLAHRLQPERWRAMCEARKLSGLKRGKVRRTPMGVDVRVTLGGSLTLETLTARIKDLETGLGTRRGAIRVEGLDSAHKALVRITVRNPLKKPVPWDAPAGPVTITDPARLSMNPFGEWTEIDLRQRILVVGASGSGKSSVQRVLSAPVVLAVDADLEVWDLKQGTESQHYAGLADVRVTTPDECRARIKYLREVEIPRRAAIMQKLKTSTWPTSAQYRDRVVMVDEGAALIRELDEDELGELFTFLEQARAYGIYLWWATQFPKSSNLPTELRSQMSAVIALKMRRASESRVVFEDLTREGWTPHRLPGKGWLMLLDDDHQDPEESRAAWLDEKAFRRLIPGQTPAVEAAPERLAIEAAPAAPVIPPMPTEPPTVPAPREEESAAADPEPLDELPTLDAVRAALADASAGGSSAAELTVATGRGKSQVYAALQELQDDGAVVKVGRGRYALASTEAGEVTA